MNRPMILVYIRMWPSTASPDNRVKKACVVRRNDEKMTIEVLNDKGEWEITNGAFALYDHMMHETEEVKRIDEEGYHGGHEGSIGVGNGRVGGQPMENDAADLPRHDHAGGAVGGAREG